MKKIILFIISSIVLFATDSFQYSDKYVETKSPINIYYYKPKVLKAKTKILFVIHGDNRNAEKSLTNFIDMADKAGYIVIAPEFSKANFKSMERFHLGNTYTDDALESDGIRKPIPSERWDFTMIERLFAVVNKKFGLHEKEYNIFGHSAGSQFVSRMLFFLPTAHINKAVLANAGWYTMPDFDLDIPYGIKNSVIDKNHLKQAFAKKVYVLLGEKDIKRSGVFRKTKEADAQGKTRVERGKTFYKQTKMMAEKLNTKFNWELYTVPNSGHNAKLMGEFATRFLD